MNYLACTFLLRLARCPCDVTACCFAHSQCAHPSFVAMAVAPRRAEKLVQSWSLLFRFRLLDRLLAQQECR